MNRQRWSFQSFSLRQKIILTSLICFMVPVSIMLWISSSFTTNLIKEQTTTNATESIKLVRSHIANRINGMLAVANFIQYDSTTTTFLKNRSSQTGIVESTQRTYNMLTALANDNKGMYITILTPDRRYYSNYWYYEHDPLLFFDEPWLAELEQLSSIETYWLGVHENYIQSEKSRNPHMITIARTLQITANSKPYAYIIISVFENQFSDLFSNYSEQNLMLISKDGRVVAAKEGVGARLTYMSQLQDTPAGSIIQVANTSYLLVKEQLPYDEWLLVNLIPYDSAIAKVNRIYQTNFYWQIAFLTLFLAILVYLLRQFTKPIGKLGRVASTIESGNLSIRSHIRGGDEIGKLGRSFDHMLDRIELMVDQITLEQERKRKAELSMLQAQIHPHFLFNILNSIRLRISLRGDRENAALLSSLSKLLRMTIGHQDELVPLHEEAAVAEKYIQLMQSTLKEPFQYRIQLASETLMVLVPRFILQPVIENALIHGLLHRSGMMEIAAWMEKDVLIITVRDDGQGMTEAQLADLIRSLRDSIDGSSERMEVSKSNRFSGIGLANVNDRLKLIYGAETMMKIESAPEQGTTIQIVIPLGGQKIHVENDDRG
jgi:two-component system sensor histidine kinase YesM